MSIRFDGRVAIVTGAATGLGRAHALALAGVMGGEDSGVSATTTDILLESAVFDPGFVRRASRTLGLISDSSYRFERGVDPEMVASASARAAELIVQIAGGVDRITADVVSQANLIRNTISQCNLQYSLSVASGSVLPKTDPYPASDTSLGTAVASLVCDPTGSTSLWNDKMLPPPTSGFSPWMYIDASASGGGRCIWITPSGSNPANNLQVTGGLTRAASKFNSSTSFSTSTEALYNPAGTSQTFVVWITLPTGMPNSHCSSN